MPFGKLLKKLTKEKGLTYKEIAKICNENKGKNFITEGYIKEIANNRKNPPTEEKIRAIAQALVINEHLLVLEGYIDKAPQEIIDLLNNIRNYTALAGLASIENTVNKNMYELAKYELYNQSMSEFFVDFIDEDNIEFTSNKHFKISRENLNFTINYDNISFYEVKDNSMANKIEIGDFITININAPYKNGDILALKIKGTNDIIYRMVHFNNAEKIVSLTPLNNKEYKEISYNREDIEIIGKVAKVIKEL